MVTPLNTELLGFLLPIFVLILVFTIIYAILQKTKIFGDNVNINAWIAVAVAVIFILMPGAMEFIAIIAPWFVVLVIVAFCLLLVFLLFGYGAKEDQLANLAKNGVIQWTVIIIGIIILIVALTNVFGPIIGQPTPTGEGTGREIQRSLFNVKILATIFILLVASQAVKFISMGRNT